MIATPPPAEPEYVSTSAILFLADEGASILRHNATFLINCRHRPSQNCHRQVPPTTPPLARRVPCPCSPIILRRTTRKLHPHARPQRRTPALPAACFLLGYRTRKGLANQSLDLPHHVGSRFQALARERRRDEIQRRTPPGIYRRWRQRPPGAVGVFPELSVTRSPRE